MPKHFRAWPVDRLMRKNLQFSIPISFSSQEAWPPNLNWQLLCNLWVNIRLLCFHEKRIPRFFENWKHPNKSWFFCQSNLVKNRENLEFGIRFSWNSSSKIVKRGRGCKFAKKNSIKKSQGHMNWRPTKQNKSFPIFVYPRSI